MVLNPLARPHVYVDSGPKLAWSATSTDARTTEPTRAPETLESNASYARVVDRSSGQPVGTMYAHLSQEGRARVVPEYAEPHSVTDSDDNAEASGRTITVPVYADVSQDDHGGRVGGQDKSGQYAHAQESGLRPWERNAAYAIAVDPSASDDVPEYATVPTTREEEQPRRESAGAQRPARRCVCRSKALIVLDNGLRFIRGCVVPPPSYS